MNTEEQDNPRVRTSDAEREHVAEILRTAVSDGRLTLQEGDERLAALYATKFRDELAPLTADLPNDGPSPGQRGSGGRRPGSAGPPWAQAGQPGSGQQSGSEHQCGGYGPSAYGRRAPGRGLRFLAIVAVLVGIFTLSHGHFFWPIIPLAFVTIALMRFGAHWLYRRGGRPS